MNHYSHYFAYLFLTILIACNQSGNQSQETSTGTTPSSYATAPQVAALQEAQQRLLASSPIAATASSNTRWDTLLLVEQPIQGIDVSHHQNTVDWKTVKLDSLSFAICKATGGITYTDPAFSTNWTGIKAANIIRGAYHFYYSNDAPEAQANNYLNAIGALEQYDLPAILDIEGGGLKGDVDKAQLSKDLLTWLQLVETKTGKRPIVYSGLNFANDYLTDTAFARYPLWIAQYTDKAAPDVPTAWSSVGWTFWQQRDDQTEAGVDTKVDYDLFNGKREAFKGFVEGE